MTGTRRTPIRRQHEPPVSETSIKIFMQMQRLVCTCTPNKPYDDCPGCQQWWDLEHRLRHELGARLWEFPCIEHPAWGNPEPPGTYNHARWQPDEKGRERWRALQHGANELRRREKQRAKAERNAQLDATDNALAGSTAPNVDPEPHAASEQSESIDPNDAVPPPHGRPPQY
jgi:hypothetical protein